MNNIIMLLFDHPLAMKDCKGFSYNIKIVWPNGICLGTGMIIKLYGFFAPKFI